MTCLIFHVPGEMIGGGRKKVALKLTASRKVDPYLTRTIKILRNSISSNPAYENFLLLLSFRIPRLRRALIRRTGRQLTRAALPPHIRDLYLKLVKERRVVRGQALINTPRRSRSRPARLRTMSRSRNRSKARKWSKSKSKTRSSCIKIEKAVVIEPEGMSIN